MCIKIRLREMVSSTPLWQTTAVPGPLGSVGLAGGVLDGGGGEVVVGGPDDGDGPTGDIEL